MATHSSTLAWKIPWTEEPGRLQSMRLQRVGHDWTTSLSLFTFMHWRRKWQPTPAFLPGESQGRGSLVGCCQWGRTESVGHNWSDLTAAAAVEQIIPHFSFFFNCIFILLLFFFTVFDCGKINIKFTILSTFNCTVQWHWVYPHSCAVISRTFSFFQTGTPYPLNTPHSNHPNHHTTFYL